MARFYSTVTSKHSTQTKCGNADGMSAHVRGWDIGCDVELYCDGDGNDQILIVLTGGSNDPSTHKVLFDSLAGE